MSPCSALGIEALNNGGVGKLIGIIGGIGSFDVATAIVAACGLACVIFCQSSAKNSCVVCCAHRLHFADVAA